MNHRAIAIILLKCNAIKYVCMYACMNVVCIHVSMYATQRFDVPTMTLQLEAFQTTIFLHFYTCTYRHINCYEPQKAEDKQKLRLAAT